MNIERLRYLVVLSESRTFSEAADRLFTSSFGGPLRPDRHSDRGGKSRHHPRQNDFK